MREGGAGRGSIMSWTAKTMRDHQTTVTLISVIAMTLSAVSLGWNVYRDVILKPRVKVRASIRAVVHLGVNNDPPIKLMVTAVNFGPGDVYCQSVLARNARLFRRLTRRVENWFVLHESPQLPQKLTMGQPLNVMIPYKA